MPKKLFERIATSWHLPNNFNCFVNSYDDYTDFKLYQEKDVLTQHQINYARFFFTKLKKKKYSLSSKKTQRPSFLSRLYIDCTFAVFENDIEIKFGISWIEKLIIWPQQSVSFSNLFVMYVKWDNICDKNRI